MKSKVAFLYTTPETVLEDYQRLFELAGGAAALQPGVTTILKDNISWHFPMPGANTTPWQLEGTILALRAAGLRRPGLRAEPDRGHQRLQGRGPERLRAHLPRATTSRCATTSARRT